MLDGYLYKQGFGKYDNFCFLYRDAIEKFVYEKNIQKLTNVAKKITTQLIDLNLHSDNQYKMQDVINFNLNLLDSVLGEKK